MFAQPVAIRQKKMFKPLTPTWSSMSIKSETDLSDFPDFIAVAERKDMDLVELCHIVTVTMVLF